MGKKGSLPKKPSPVVPQRGLRQPEGRGWGEALLFSREFILLILFLAGIIWYGIYDNHPHGVLGSDDREYASIARNIVQGKGVVRNSAYPIDIQFFKKLPIPEFMHPPGYPLVLAGFFRVFGVSETAALLPSYLSYFILIVLFFFFARRQLDSRRAVLATLILIFNREILEISQAALSEAVYTPIFFLFFVVMVRARSLREVFLAGLLLGTSHLIRENIYPFLLPLFVYLYSYPDLPRWKKMLLFSTGIMIPIVPNLLRSLWATGSPFFSYGKFVFMTFTEKYPWLDIYRDIQNPSLLQFLIEEGDQFFVKYFNNLMTAFKQIPTITTPFLFAFLFIDMFSWRISPFWKRTKILFLLLLISQIFFVSLITFTRRYFVPFVPLMILFAMQGFFTISESVLAAIQARRNKRILTLLVSIFIMVLMVPTLSVIFYSNRPSSPGSKNTSFGFLMSREKAESLNLFLKAHLKEDQVIWTDLPEVLEWEGNRLCGWLPTQIKDIYQIHKKIPVDAILLTSLRTPRQMEVEWRNLLKHEQGLPQYRNVKFYRGENLSAKLLIRDGKE
jgi:4-amino-4-deoxy-L-arabinose transferase-like glycosyltransferase